MSPVTGDKMLFLRLNRYLIREVDEEVGKDIYVKDNFCIGHGCLCHVLAHPANQVVVETERQLCVRRNR